MDARTARELAMGVLRMKKFSLRKCKHLAANADEEMKSPVSFR